MNLPEHIINKIMLYVSHPVADIMRLEVESCLEHYVPINNGYEYEYGGEESFVEAYFKFQNWLKKEGEDKLVYSNGYDPADDLEAETESGIETVESDDDDEIIVPRRISLF